MCVLRVLGVGLGGLGIGGWLRLHCKCQEQYSSSSVVRDYLSQMFIASYRFNYHIMSHCVVLSNPAKATTRAKPHLALALQLIIVGN